MFKSPSVGRLLVIFGENGTGKSRLSKLVHRWFNFVSREMPHVERPDLDEGSVGLPWSLLCHWPTVIDDFQKHKILIPTGEIYAANLVIIDDVGAEHDPSRYGIEQLYLCLSRREFKWTILTTNILPREWDQKFERRIASRLFRNSTHVDMSNVPDFSAV